MEDIGELDRKEFAISFLSKTNTAELRDVFSERLWSHLRKAFLLLFLFVTRKAPFCNYLNTISRIIQKRKSKHLVRTASITPELPLLSSSLLFSLLFFVFLPLALALGLTERTCFWIRSNHRAH